MGEKHGGTRTGSGRKRKKKDENLQEALAQAIPFEEWVSIWTNIANIADQCEDKRAVIMAARELRQLRDSETRRTQKPPASEPENEPQPFEIVYENYNHFPREEDLDEEEEKVYSRPAAVETGVMRAQRDVSDSIGATEAAREEGLRDTGGFGGWNDLIMARYESEVDKGRGMEGARVAVARRGVRVVPEGVVGGKVVKYSLGLSP